MVTEVRSALSNIYVFSSHMKHMRLLLTLPTTGAKYCHKYSYSACTVWQEIIENGIKIL